MEGIGCRFFFQIVAFQIENDNSIRISTELFRKQAKSWEFTLPQPSELVGGPGRLGFDSAHKVTKMCWSLSFSIGLRDEDLYPVSFIYLILLEKNNELDALQRTVSRVEIWGRTQFYLKTYKS